MYQTAAGAMAVRGDRILAVGSRAEVERFAGPQTEHVDLAGKTVLPGLVDSHVHASAAAMYEWERPVPDLETVADVLKYIRGRAAAAQPGEWITLSQIFITRLKDQRFPTRVELDAAAPRNPAVLQAWGVSQVYSISAPSYRGMRFIEPEKLYQILKTAIQHELQPTAHAVGDGAVSEMAEAYERINRELPVRAARPSISHSNCMTADAIRRIKDMGVVLDLQPVWLWLDSATPRKQFGDARPTYFQPYRSLFDARVMAGGGSDHMQKIGSPRSINPHNPWLGMWTTLTRQARWTDAPMHPEQRITRREAIRLYTINNAYLTFTEEGKGSLDKGKLADFIVLDRDVLTCPVEQTYLGGRRVHQRR